MYARQNGKHEEPLLYSHQASSGTRRRSTGLISPIVTVCDIFSELPEKKILYIRSD
jgi:hypothetical protein